MWRAPMFLAAFALAMEPVFAQAEEPASGAVAASLNAADLSRLLAGKWSVQERMGETWFSSLFTYRDDGTFAGEFRYRIGQERRMIRGTGTWRIQGGRLSRRDNPSNGDTRTPRCAMPVDWTILSITAQEFRFIDENGDQRLARRTELNEPLEPSPTMGYRVDRLALYQPDEVMAARVPDTARLAGYVKALEGVCSQFFASSDQAARVDVVVAVRPEKRSKVWLDWPGADDAGKDALRKHLEAVAPVEVKEGPIALAIIGRTGGEPRSSEPEEKKEEKTPPIPKEWREAAAGSEKPLMLPDGILDRIWPAK